MFHLRLQKERNIPTLYKKLHDFLGHPEVHARDTPPSAAPGPLPRPRDPGSAGNYSQLGNRIAEQNNRTEQHLY